VNATTLITGIVAMFCSLFSLGAQQQRTPERDSAAVLALEHEWIGTRDSATLDHLLAPDFLHPVPTGQIITKTEHIRWWVTAHSSPSNFQSRFDQLDVRVFGDAAIADGSVITTDRSGDEVGRNVFSDVFLYRSGRWQAVNAQETNVVTGPPPRLGPNALPCNMTMSTNRPKRGVLIDGDQPPEAIAPKVLYEFRATPKRKSG
jgi:hypothetical protein